MSENKKLQVQGIEITLIQIDQQDFISLTDIAKHKSDDTSATIGNWMRNRNTIEFLGLWETLYNPDFKPTEFEGFRIQAGLNAFTLSPQKCVNATQAIGFVVKSGRYGGTYAIKENLIPAELTKQRINLVYASEADLLNVALFGKTAKQWRDENPSDKGNIRDYANVPQLVCLANLENLNAHLIQQNLPQSERIRLLNLTAIQQMRLLTDDRGVQKLQRGKS